MASLLKKGLQNYICFTPLISTSLTPIFTVFTDFSPIFVPFNIFYD